MIASFRIESSIGDSVRQLEELSGVPIQLDARVDAQTDLGSGRLRNLPLAYALRAIIAGTDYQVRASGTGFEIVPAD